MSSPHPHRPDDGRRPPFSPAAARTHRQQLGMALEQVAHGMAAFGVQATAATVAALEAGAHAPTETELAALAGALWCDRADLTGRVQTLRDHRLAQGLSLDDAAAVLGVHPDAYAAMEDEDRLDGADPRRAAMLARTLHLSVRATVALTGGEEPLREALTQAVQGWYKGYVRTVTGLVPLPRATVQDALRRLHTAYQSLSAGSTNWASIFANEEDTPVSDEGARAWLDTIVDHFWDAVDAVAPRAG